MATSVTRGNASIAQASATSQLVPCGTNLVVLRGVLRRDPEYRTLPSGDELLSFDLTVREDDLPAETVPVVWLNPAVSAAKLAERDDVVVIAGPIEAGKELEMLQERYILRVRTHRMISLASPTPSSCGRST